MTAFEIIHAVAIAYAGVWASYVVLLPLIAAFRRSRDGIVENGPGKDAPTIAVIVPAHNMSQVISRCIESLLGSDYPTNKFDIHVVADHCTDDTAEQARLAGASVHTRDEGPAGKTYTLAWAFDKLTELGIEPDLYVIVDATAIVETGFLGALVAVWQQGEDIIVSHPVLDEKNQRWFARCLGLTLVHRNLQNRARQHLGLSAFIEGRGMAYSRRYIQQFGLSLALPTSTSSGTHPTEDWRHAVRAVEQGMRVAFADGARVITPLRSTLTAATKQGVRWERGRMSNAATHAVRLLVRGLRQRSLVKSLAALDAIQPPVAILGAFCVVIALFSMLFPVPQLSIAMSYVPLALFVLYGLAVVMEGRKDGIRPVTVIWAPIYLAWRCTTFVLAWGFLDRLKFSAKSGK